MLINKAKKLKPQSGLCDKPVTNQTEMTNLRELEEEIETYEGTWGFIRAKCITITSKKTFLYQTTHITTKSSIEIPL